MIPDPAMKKRIQSLPKRHWIYLDGKTNPEIEIPEFKKEGEVKFLRPQTAKAEPKKQQRNLTVFGAIRYLMNPFKIYPTNSNNSEESNSDKEDLEDSQFDGLSIDDKDALFPEEF